MNPQQIALLGAVPLANIGTVPLDSLVRGDTWQGINSIGPILVNNAQPPTTLTAARMSFKRAATDIAPAYVLGSAPVAGHGTLTITDATNWALQVPPQPLPLDVGTWYWDLELTDSAGHVYTYVIATLTVTADIST